MRRLLFSILVKNLKTILALIAFMLMAVLAFGKDHSNGHGNGKNKHSESKSEEKAESKSSKDSGSVKLVLSTREREVCQAYANANAKSLPPGLAKKVARGKELPPGWQKKLAVGKPMPEEVFKVACPLPKDLIVKLPPSPVGTITVAVEGKIVRLMEKSKEILDILDLPMPKF